jgi:hypothetical protein
MSEVTITLDKTSVTVTGCTGAGTFDLDDQGSWTALLAEARKEPMRILAILQPVPTVSCYTGEGASALPQGWVFDQDPDKPHEYRIVTPGPTRLRLE